MIEPQFIEIIFIKFILNIIYANFNIVKKKEGISPARGGERYPLF